MLNDIPKEIVDLLKEDGSRKYIRVRFPDRNGIDNEGVERDILSHKDMVDGSFEFTESVNSSNTITLQLLETPSVRFSLGDWTHPFKGATIIITNDIVCDETVDGAIYEDDVEEYVYQIPIGRFIVTSCKVEADMKTRNVEAFAFDVYQDLQNNVEYLNMINVPWYTKDSKVHIYMSDIEEMYGPQRTWATEYVPEITTIDFFKAYFVDYDEKNKVHKFISSINGIKSLRFTIDRIGYSKDDFDYKCLDYYRENCKKGSSSDVRSYCQYRMIVDDFTEYTKRFMGLFYDIKKSKVSYTDQNGTERTFDIGYWLKTALLYDEADTVIYGNNNAFIELMHFVLPTVKYRIPESYSKHIGADKGETNDKVEVPIGSEKILFDTPGLDDKSYLTKFIGEYNFVNDLYPLKFMESYTGYVPNRFMWETTKNVGAEEQYSDLLSDSYYYILTKNSFRIPKRIKIKIEFETVSPDVKIDDVYFEVDCRDLLHRVETYEATYEHVLKREKEYTDEEDSIKLERTLNSKLKVAKYGFNVYSARNSKFIDLIQNGMKTPLRDPWYGYCSRTAETRTNKKNYFADFSEVTDFNVRNIFSSYAEFYGYAIRINRKGEFSMIRLNGVDGLKPAIDLYPEENLYPRGVDAGTYFPCHYKTCWYDDGGTVRPIGKIACYYMDKSVYEEADKQMEDPEKSYKEVILVDDYDDLRYKTYYVNNNWFIDNTIFTEDEIREVLKRIGQGLTNITYTPCEIDMLGRPDIEAGDFLNVVMLDGTSFKTIVFRRTLTGADFLEDSIECESVDNGGSYGSSSSSGGSYSSGGAGGGGSSGGAVQSVNGLTGNVKIAVPTYVYDPTTKTLIFNINSQTSTIEEE